VKYWNAVAIILSAISLGIAIVAATSRAEIGRYQLHNGTITTQYFDTKSSEKETLVYRVDTVTGQVWYHQKLLGLGSAFPEGAECWAPIKNPTDKVNPSPAVPSVSPPVSH
jgi:hypothetical protein